MIKNYFKTALRNILRNKTRSLVNIAGLVVGFAAFLLIFLVVQYEQSFDDFHPNRENIYRVVRIGKDAVNPEYRTGVPFPVTQTLRAELPQLKNTAAIYGYGTAQVNIVAPDGSILKKLKAQNIALAEPDFFRTFNFSLAEGNINTALNDPDDALITKEEATRYFGNWKEAVGKTISLFNTNIKITGILNNPPSNTDFPLGLVLSYRNLTKDLDLTDWTRIDDANYCFVQLNDKSSLAQFSSLLAAFTKKHITPVNPGYNLSLQPLSELHFDSRFGNFSGRTFSHDLIFALRLIGLFLLIIACVNFINLTTAQAINRAREVGVRKVLGGRRSQLVLQFLGETGITTFIALLLALIVVVACLPFVDSLLDIQLPASALLNAGSVAFVLGAFVLVTFLSGFYPALVLSGFKPVTVLKSISISGNQGISLRRVLVVLQFVIAQALIIGTLVVASQMDYFRNADLGFNKDAVITTGLPGDSLSHTRMDFFRNEISKIPGVQKVSFSTFTPTTNGGWFADLQTEKNKGNNSLIISMKPADTSYFSLYQLPLVAGRVYFPSDTVREFMVNETTVKNMGIPHPADAVGRLITVWGKSLPIVGVVKDFHTNSLRDPIAAVVFTTNKNSYGVTSIKINMKQAKSVIASLEKTWNQYYPDYMFEYSFLDQSVADDYQQENQLSQLYKVFSGIAIFISCLGLYGLIAFMAVQRRKEISIRKVLGAPVRDIVVMLSKEFTLLITLAFVIASPLAWYFMNQWLQQYTYRINLGVWFFLLTIVASLCIAWLTVGYTAIRAAIANPVKSLRTE